MSAKFFITRPRFAIVISLVLMIAGALCASSLPIKQYPDIAPPQIMVIANYPGADAQTVANTVGIPIEEAVNGVENMLYMSSTSSNNGTYSLSIVFETGTNPDTALIKVQNKVQQTTSQLPSEVTAMGIRVVVTMSNMLGFVALTSPNGTRSELFMTDYVISNVQNRFKRIPGMGDVSVMGAKYSLRVWADPDKLSALGLSIGEVYSAIRAQNAQAALGSIGTSPAYGQDTPIVYSIITKGRLSDAEEFGEIILKHNEAGALVKLKDVARIELGAESYTMNSTYMGRPCAMIMLSQGADANALDVMAGVKTAIEEMSRFLPEDLEFVTVYDSTDFVKVSIREILETLALTFGLVVFVCYLFLQNWRVTLVPSAAIPVSLMATFISLAVLGYSINTFTLFGLVLVIGTVVDDAIVVVERVLYIMETENLPAPEATERAMRDVSGPMIATTLVFLAIFVPVAFMGGITGEIYRQFGVTMSFAVVCSTTVAFTLSPAMCAGLLSGIKPKTRGPLAWFNKLLEASTSGFVRVSVLIAKSFIVLLLCLGAVCAASLYIMKITPTSFVPDEDQGSFMGVVQLPEGASRGRTSSFLNSMLPELAAVDGVHYNVGIEGYSFMGGAGENMGSFLLVLDNWEKRTTPELSQSAVLARASAIAGQHNEGRANIFAMGGIPGLGMTNGLELRLQAVDKLDTIELASVTQDFLAKINSSPEFLYAFCSYTADTPHIFLDIDRSKAESMGVSVSSIFSTLAMYLGTVYVNDINIGTQSNKVMLQGDWNFRNSIEDIGRIHVTSTAGLQVPLNSFVTLRHITAPRSLNRFNLYPCTEITAMIADGYSSGQGMERIAELARELPRGYSYEWAGQTFQEQRQGNQFLIVVSAAVIFGFLFLVAQYESWSTPLAVMLSLPVAVLGALRGIRYMNITLSIYTQLGILLLVGLASKNAILIIEFAKEERELRGTSIIDAAAEAARERFRSVLMTAFTCVLGALPMLMASGAGAASRVHVGTTMVFGMTAATVFGIFLIPGLFVMMQTLREGIKARIRNLFAEHDEDYEDEEDYDDDDDEDEDDD